MPPKYVGLFIHHLKAFKEYLLAYSVYWLGYGLDDRRIGFDFWQGEDIFPFSTASRRAIEPTQLPT
jgi:hypothetical protein